MSRGSQRGMKIGQGYTVLPYSKFGISAYRCDNRYISYYLPRDGWRFFSHARTHQSIRVALHDGLCRSLSCPATVQRKTTLQ